MKMKINSLYNMDCLKGIQLLENDSIDLVITSPLTILAEKAIRITWVIQNIYHFFIRSSLYCI